MYKNEYQGGRHFEIFSAQGKDPTNAWKLYGSSGIRKIFEREVKSFIYSLEGNVSTTKMQLPKDLKQSLTLVQRYLIVQMYVPKGAEFMLEAGITDVLNNKRRLNLSTSTRDVNVTPLHAKLPLTILKKSVWVNCCLDMVNIVSDVWPGQTFGKTDHISISANCKIRRIFTMKAQPNDTTDDRELYGMAIEKSGEMDSIPHQLQLHSDVLHYTQLLDMHKLRAVENRTRGEKPSIVDLDLNTSGRRSQLTSGTDNSFHIAFGTKVGKPPTAGPRKSSNSALPSTREPKSSLLSARESRDFVSPVVHPVSALPGRQAERYPPSNRQRLSSDPGSNTGPRSAVQYLHSSSQPPMSDALNQSRSWSGAEFQQIKQQETPTVFVKPHPPLADSAPGGRRRPKVRSGDINNRTAADSHQHPSHIPISVNRLPETLDSVISPENGNTSLISPPNGRKSPIMPSRKVKLAPVQPRNAKQYINHSVLDIDLRRSKALHPIENNQSTIQSMAHNSSVIPKSHAPNSKPVVPRLIDSLEEKSDEEGAGDHELSDVIHQLNSKVDELDLTHESSDNSLSEDEDEVMTRQMMESLQKFAASDNAESSEDEGLYQFRALPKAVSKRLASPDQKIQPFPSEGNLELDNYHYPAYTTDPKPHPPLDLRRHAVSPAVSPRPGSGRIRSKPTSRIHSEKATPDSSGTGEELKSQLAVNGYAIGIRSSRDPSPGSPREPHGLGVKNPPRLSKQTLGLELMPSPRSSDREPRISSAGNRSNSANSGKTSSTDSSVPLGLQATAPGISALRNSTRSPSSSRGSTRLSRKSLREIPARHLPGKSDSQHFINSLEPIKSYEPTRYKQVEETFDENEMLKYLKREQETGNSLRDDEHNSVKSEKRRRYEHEVEHSDGDHSSDESFATTSAPPIGSHDYKEEMMDTLERSDSRDVGMFSPPVTLAATRQSSEKTSNGTIPHPANNKIGLHQRQISERHSDSEEELDLVYDPDLNCYYDPVNNKYYELR